MTVPGSFIAAQSTESQFTMPASAAAVLAVSLAGVALALFSRRGYRGPRPSDDRPVTFGFSWVWGIAMYAMAAGFLAGPRLFPPSPEKFEKEKFIFWLGPLLSVFLIASAEYLRRNHRIRVFGSHIAYFKFDHWVTVPLNDLESISVIGTAVVLRRRVGEPIQFGIAFANVSGLVALLSEKIAEARRADLAMRREGV